MAETSNMICPVCETFQSRAERCNKCGVVIAKAKKPMHVELSTSGSSKQKKFPVAIIVVVLIIIIPFSGIFLFSRESNRSSDASSEVSSSSVKKSEQDKKSDIKKIAAYNPAIADKVQREKVMSKLQSLKSMLYMLGTKDREPPSNEEGLQLLVDNDYLDQENITDEWGNTFVYRLEWGKDDGFFREYKIFLHSKGPDGVSGNGDDIQTP